MATDSGKTSFSGFFSDPQAGDNVRRQFIETPLDASAPEALSSVLELAKVLAILPDAFVASQKRELERVKATSKKNDPRLAALQASIQQSEALQTIARKGQARVKSLALGAATGEEVFHGFVSASDFTPLSGVTVRLTGKQISRGKAVATTDEDGYFRIALPPSERGTAEKKQSLSLSQRINAIMTPRIAEPADTNTGKAKEDVGEATVQILRKTQVLHEDPVPVMINRGSVYREYLVANERSSSKASNDYASEIWAEQATAETSQTVDEPIKKKSRKK